MRFLTLTWKEFRESLPWILLAAIVLLLIGGFILQMETRHQTSEWRYQQIEPGKALQGYQLFNRTVLTFPGIWLFMVSIALGLVLGARQFWMAHFTKTWGFELHRSVNRITILAAKLFATVLGFCLSIGLVWTIFYYYASQPGLFVIPPSTRTFIEGWIFIALGFVAYLAAALVGLSSMRWYTTKIFGIAFALVVFLTTIHWNLSWIFTALVVGTVILLPQIIYTFSDREF